MLRCTIDIPRVYKGQTFTPSLSATKVGDSGHQNMLTSMEKAMCLGDMHRKR